MLSAGFALARTESAVLGPIQGHLIDRYGPRRIMRIGVVMFGAGFLVLSVMQATWQFFIGMVILAVGASFAGTLSVTVAVVNWFRRRRALALAFATAGFAVGGLVVPAVAAFIGAFGWRSAAMTSGLLMLLVGPFAVQVIRHRPEDVGLTVDGIEADPGPTPTAASLVGIGESTGEDLTATEVAPAPPRILNYTAKQAMATSAFWRISAGHTLIVMLVNALMVHLIPHLTGNLGYGIEFAAGIVALVTILQLVGKFFGGFVGDRVDKRTIATVAMGMHAVGAFILAMSVTPPMIILFAVLHGIAWGARGPLLQAWRADLFGAYSFGSIMGYSSLLVMFGAAAGPLIAGVLFDVLGDYRLAFGLFGVLSLLGGILFAGVRAPTPPEGEALAQFA